MGAFVDGVFVLGDCVVAVVDCVLDGLVVAPGGFVAVPYDLLRSLGLEVLFDLGACLESSKRYPP